MNLRVLVIPFIFLSSFSFAEECSIDELTELEYKDIECQFYMGTAAFRNNVYSVAAAHWNYIIDAPMKHSGDDKFKAMSLSTVTYLTYQGLGVKQDRELAVNNWKKAVKGGDFEARRHIAFAYSDKNYSPNDLVKSLGWYESVLLIKVEMKDLSEAEQRVIEDAIEGSRELKLQLSMEQIQKAKVFAKSTL
ncbi:hypothetical protein AB4222_11105 [Vibrio splendidus]